MKRRTTRLLSLALAIIMIVGMLPFAAFTAFAEETITVLGTGTEADPYLISSYMDLIYVASLTQQSTIGDVYIKLAQNITQTDSRTDFEIIFGSPRVGWGNHFNNIHFDLNGKWLHRTADGGADDPIFSELSRPVAGSSMFIIEDGSTLHVFDSSEEKTGKLSFYTDRDKDMRIFELLGAGSELIVDDGIFEGLYGVYGIMTVYNAKVTINGGNWDCGRGLISTYNLGNNRSVIDVYGGAFVQSHKASGFSIFDLQERSEVNIYGGQFTSNSDWNKAILNNKGNDLDICIYGGRFVTPYKAIGTNLLDMNIINNRSSLIVWDSNSNKLDAATSNDISVYAPYISDIYVDGKRYQTDYSDVYDLFFEKGDHNFEFRYPAVPELLKNAGYYLDFSLYCNLFNHTDWSKGDVRYASKGDNTEAAIITITVGNDDTPHYIKPYVAFHNSVSHTQLWSQEYSHFEIYKSGGSSKVINEVSATVKEPMQGDLPNYKVSDPSNLYSAAVVEWYFGGWEQEPGTLMTSDTEFEKGFAYVAKIKFTPKEGYVFGNNVTAEINGQPAFLSGNDPTTFNVSFVAKESYISFVEIEEVFGATGYVDTELTSKTIGVESASVFWKRDGAYIGMSELYAGHYEGYVSLTAANGYIFDENTIVTVFGQTLSAESVVGQGKFLSAICEFDYECEHKQKNKYFDDYNHWDECWLCEEKFDIEEHDWYLDHVQDGESIYYCYRCYASRVVEGIQVNSLSLSALLPIVGLEICNFNPANTYQADKASVTSTTWYIGSVDESNKLPMGTAFEAGNTYYAVVDVEAQNGCFFNGYLNISVDELGVLWGGYKVATITSETTATVQFEYTPVPTKSISVTIPEAEIGMTIESVFRGFVFEADSELQYIIGVKQYGEGDVLDYNYAFQYYPTTDSFSGDTERLSEYIKAGKRYEVYVGCNFNNYTQVGYINDYSVTNDYDVEYNAELGEGALLGITAKYQMEPGVIETIEFSDFPMPVIGATPSTTLTVNTPGLSLHSMKWNCTETFEEGMEYKATITLALNREHGYSILPTTGIELNCPYDITYTVSDMDMIVRVIVTFPALTPGVTVSGTVNSFGEADGSVTVELKQGDSVIYTTATTNGNYSFASVPNGTYTLAVSKDNHTTREYEITVESVAVTHSAEIFLIGDVTGDGKVNNSDVSRLFAHAMKTNQITDVYMLKVADVTGDGKVNNSDVSRLFAHAMKTNLLF